MTSNSKRPGCKCARLLCSVVSYKAAKVKRGCCNWEQLLLFHRKTHFQQEKTKRTVCAMGWGETILELMHKERVKFCETQKQICICNWLSFRDLDLFVVYIVPLYWRWSISIYQSACVPVLWHTELINMLNWGGE